MEPLINPSDHDILIRLDQRVVDLTAKLDNHLSVTQKVIDDHETRLRAVEANQIAFRTQVKVWGSIIASAVTLVSIIISLLKK